MRSRYIAATVLLAMAVAGCTSSPAPRVSRPTGWATPPEALRVACPGTRTTAARRSAALPEKPIPARFIAVAVVRCNPAVAFVNGNGPDAPATRQVATADLGRLMTALRAPSARPEPKVICPAQRIYVAWFVLIAGNGQIIRPAIPVTVCGEPSAAVLASLGALRWRNLP